MAFPGRTGGREAALRAAAGETAAMSTNITEGHRRAFEALTGGVAGSFCLFSRFVSGTTAQAPVSAVWAKNDRASSAICTSQGIFSDYAAARRTCCAEDIDRKIDALAEVLSLDMLQVRVADLHRNVEERAGTFALDIADRAQLKRWREGLRAIRDELPMLHRVPSLQPCLAESRQFGGCFAPGVQMVSALRDLYGRNGAETVSGPCGRHRNIAPPVRPAGSSAGPRRAS